MHFPSSCCESSAPLGRLVFDHAPGLRVTVRVPRTGPSRSPDKGGVNLKRSASRTGSCEGRSQKVHNPVRLPISLLGEFSSIYLSWGEAAEPSPNDCSFRLRVPSRGPARKLRSASRGRLSAIVTVLLSPPAVCRVSSGGRANRAAERRAGDALRREWLPRWRHGLPLFARWRLRHRRGRLRR